MMMKKFLMKSVAAVAVITVFTSCNKDIEMISPNAFAQNQYKAAFTNYVGGSIAANQDWGFGDDTTKGVTRTITVNGDAYDKFPSTADVAAYFPTTIPADADEVSQLETLYKGTKVQTQYGEATLYDIYAIYANKIVEGYNLKITQTGTTELGGNYQNASWDGEKGMNLAHPYNVYVNVDGNVTLRRVGATHFNLYILKGNVTLESNYGEQAGIISVAAGATLNDQRNSIAANQGIKLFNRGTVNATNTEKYDIGNFSKVYNEGKFNVSGPLTYSPGDANDSYFMNLGDDAELTAPAMTLNSTGNFFNSGKVTISGETKVTQARLFWVNAGHYTTGTMTFSAKNTTFYNYCQLIVTGNAHMYDGEFNLMANSYTEAGTGEFDNFIVNMDSNTGMNIKGNVRMIAQGDGTYQGFRTSGSNDYLLIGGKVTVDAHYHTFSISSGITYSINAVEIIKGGAVVTDEYLQSINDGAYPVLDFNGTECPYGNLTVTPNANSCGATWTLGNGGQNDEVFDIRIIGEDLSATRGSDFDFNDIVIDLKYDGTNAVVMLQAAGGTLPLRFGNGNDKVWEVHELFDVDQKVMVNTHAEKIRGAKYATKAAVRQELGYGISSAAEAKTKLKIEVYKNNEWCELTAETAEPAAKIAVDTDYQWLDERTSIKDVYPGFVSWVQNPSVANKWWKTNE
jgi:hypothetical protein